MPIETSFWFIDCRLALPLTSISSSSWVFNGAGLFSLPMATPSSSSSSSALFLTTFKGSEEEEVEDDEEEDVEDEESESLNHIKINH